jgi:hypothetical protein
MQNRTLKCSTLAVLIFFLGATAANVAAGKPSVKSASSGASSKEIPQFDSEAQCVSSVPRAWGEFKGGSAQAGLAFQAPDGTLRFLTNLPCGSQAVVALKIMRTGNGASN